MRAAQLGFRFRRRDDGDDLSGRDFIAFVHVSVASRPGYFAATSTSVASMRPLVFTMPSGMSWPRRRLISDSIALWTSSTGLGCFDFSVSLRDRLARCREKRERSPTDQGGASRDGARRAAGFVADKATKALHGHDGSFPTGQRGGHLANGCDARHCERPILVSNIAGISLKR